MRLLYISHSFPPADRPLSNVGGMQRVATELYASLRQQPGVSVRPLILRSSWRWTHVRVVPFMVRVLLRLRKTLRARDVDVILFSSMVTAALVLPFRSQLRRAGIRTATIVHGRDVTLPVGIYQRFVKHVFASLDMVMPISVAVQEQCLVRGARPEQMRRVPNGIDLERYRATMSRSEASITLRRLLGASRIPPDAFVLLSVGRQVRRKGFGWFVEHVLSQLPERVVYVLAGDGPEADAIARAARRAGVSERVFLLGRVSEGDLAALYRASDVFVMPNVPVPGDMEGFGVVMLEAGANGLPTVGSRLEGIADVIEPGINGQLVQPMDAGAFAQAIMTYVDETDRVLASELAQIHVYSAFAWDSIAERYVDTLSLLLPAGKRPQPVPVRSSTTVYAPAAAA